MILGVEWVLEFQLNSAAVELATSSAVDAVASV